jgi:hypothetical protein
MFLLSPAMTGGAWGVFPDLAVAVFPDNSLGSLASGGGDGMSAVSDAFMGCTGCDPGGGWLGVCGWATITHAIARYSRGKREDSP